MNPKNIRIKDIARMAGVSKGTVDRVLHKRGRVSTEAYEKVMKVLEEIDYKPNLIARTLSSNKNYRILALLPDPSADEYWSQTKEGILQAETEWAYYNITIEVLLFDQYNKESFKEKALEALHSKPDGIITAPIFYDEALVFFESLRNEGIPYVLFNTRLRFSSKHGSLGFRLVSSISKCNEFLFAKYSRKPRSFSRRCTEFWMSSSR